MTRRQRHLKIIASWGPHSQTYRWEFDSLLRRHGLAALTDEAVEDFARSLIENQRRHEKMAKENRAMYARIDASQGAQAPSPTSPLPNALD